MHGNTLNAYHKKYAVDYYIDPVATLEKMKAEEGLPDDEIQQYKEYADRKNPANAPNPAEDKQPKAEKRDAKAGAMKTYDIWDGHWEVESNPGPHLKGKRTFTSEDSSRNLVIWVFVKKGDKPRRAGVRMEPFRADEFNYGYQNPLVKVAVQQMFEVESKKK